MPNLSTPEFKLKCVNLMLKENRITEQVSQMIVSVVRHCSVGNHSIVKSNKISHQKRPAISAEQLEIQQFRAENEQLRSDNTLLKKVSAFLLEKS
ncbi:hypothetical protein A4G18_01460 [Pasteurellaceae bacterium Pebbles2]|nr:hypothetical protein [Pasteurellaceae bacterium Pebbles2]